MPIILDGQYLMPQLHLEKGLVELLSCSPIPHASTAPREFSMMEELVELDAGVAATPSDPFEVRQRVRQKGCGCASACGFEFAFKSIVTMLELFFKHPSTMRPTTLHRLEVETSPNRHGSVWLRSEIILIHTSSNKVQNYLRDTN